MTAADLPGPVVDSVSVDYHPTGFPNDIAGSARDTVPINFSATYTLMKSCAPATENMGDTTTYTFVITNTGNTPLTRTSAADSLLGDLTSQFPATLAAGQSVTVTVTRVTLATDPSPLPNTVTSVYSDITGTAITHTANCSITINPPPPVFAGCTLGFWKNHGLPLWQSGTTLSTAVGFSPSTTFNSFFGLTSQQSGFSDQTTMLQVLNSGGGGKIALGRQSVAALLDVGQFDMKYHVPDWLDELRNAQDPDCQYVQGYVRRLG